MGTAAIFKNRKPRFLSNRLTDLDKILPGAILKTLKVKTQQPFHQF